MTNTAWHLAQNGLNPVAEIQRHDKMASHYRTAMAAMGPRHNWKWRDLLASAVYHEESAAKLRREWK